MALKKNRVEPYDGTTMRYYVNEVAQAGSLMLLSTAASGDYYGDPANVATNVVANPSGRVALGILMNDFVNLDLTKYHVNSQQNQMPSGSKGTIAFKGEYSTNMIAGTPSGGQPAYIGNAAGAAVFTPTQTSGAQKVGQFLTGVDAAGYAVVQVQLG